MVYRWERRVWTSNWPCSVLARNDTFNSTAMNFSAQITYGLSTAPKFSKQENQFLNNYRLVHTVSSPATATISIGDERHELETTWSYQDHCSGLVPRVASWHWLSVQNDAHALVILTCYGNRPQRYAQFLYNGGWIRLDQNSSFEYSSETRATLWKVTSSDVDVSVEVLDSHPNEVRVPKLVPFMVNVRHEEFVVRVCGSVRIHGGGMMLTVCMASWRSTMAVGNPVAKLIVHSRRESP